MDKLFGTSKKKEVAVAAVEAPTLGETSQKVSPTLLTRDRWTHAAR